MKRSICLLLAFLICLVMPVTAYAETYRMNGTDLSIQVDDTIWYVFTRDNLENNPELEELGVSYDAIHSIFYDNDAYMDAVLYYGDEGYIEFFIRKTPQTSGLVNLSNYSQEDVTKFAAAFAEQHNIQEYSVYENQYKFAKMEYFDSNATPSPSNLLLNSVISSTNKLTPSSTALCSMWIPLSRNPKILPWENLC